MKLYSNPEKLYSLILFEGKPVLPPPSPNASILRNPEKPHVNKNPRDTIPRRIRTTASLNLQSPSTNVHNIAYYGATIARKNRYYSTGPQLCSFRFPTCPQESHGRWCRRGPVPALSGHCCIDARLREYLLLCAQPSCVILCARVVR